MQYAMFHKMRSILQKTPRLMALPFSPQHDKTQIQQNEKFYVMSGQYVLHWSLEAETSISVCNKFEFGFLTSYFFVSFSQKLTFIFNIFFFLNFFVVVVF